MHPRSYALFGGILMLLMGVASLIPSLSQLPPDYPIMQVTANYGLFLGIFPMNIINKVALIVFGLAGIMASRAPNTSLPASIRFSRLVLFVMGAAAVLGLIPQTRTFFGYWPLFGAEVAVHAFFAVLGAYFGYALPMKAAPRAAAV